MFYLKTDSEISVNLFGSQDARELFWLLDTNRSYLRKWLPWVDGIQSPGQIHSVIQMWEKSSQEGSSFHFGIRYRGVLAGSISLHAIDWNNSQASIGYYLGEKWQGRGITIRAVNAVINHAFYGHGLNRIEIRCGKDNQKSKAIPVKLGFRKEGIIRDGEYLNGNFHDLIVYGLLAREWNGRSAAFY
ncbi:GNAT family protein [Mesobacillus sp. AQ2]|jgi:ribosomal-protein-serine acetyltransferase|uniref:GNAT family N-acetyltransferase n=1 Tax=Bacillaceae TaxID=186817 RepID=UPI00119E2D7C|nr:MULTISPECIES: GNAT family protein [Bacillaceae]MCM3125359.1 GNAT family N-acetyltransferase [Mesobacillus sp. MER 33]MCM3235498.1 GNAT family N-acetyltransferase [Mesobacillus sp. MER 48]WHX41761.1 GNAT family protein [Mesobacillus sp. AQ2]